MIGFLIQLTAITLTLAAICLSLYLISIIRKQRRSTAYRLQKLRRERRIEVARPHHRRRPTPRPASKPELASYFIPPTYAASAARLETKLLSMLGGHQKTAIRLLVSVRQKYPSRDDQWCLEKTIRDLERDRR